MGACESRAQNSLGSKLNSASESLKIAKFYVNLDELKSSMAGEIITPENKDLYMKARERAFNQDHRGYPILIIRPANSHDVSFCIKFVNKYAKDEILCVASGCHSSRCMLDGAIVIDLVNLSEVKVNETSMTVDAGGGCYLKDVDSALMPFNYGTTVGTYPETGIGGLATAGGFGWLGRKFGLTCDNIIEVEVVLANGEIVVANNENEYADLIWGIRGGGGNFGIVTKFVLKIHQLPPYCIGGTLVNLAPTIASAIEVYVKFDQMVQVWEEPAASHRHNLRIRYHA